MRGWPYGKALSEDGKTIRYFSPSALMTGDNQTNEGCARKYFYQYVKKLKDEQKDYQKLGQDLHAHNESYLLTGMKATGSDQAIQLFYAGLHMLPRPATEDPRILVEHDIGGGNLATAPLRAAGVPVVGFIDLIHWQGTNAGAESPEDSVDPPNTVEVIDWKTTRDLKWVKTPQEVARTLQMTTYGQWAVVAKNAEWARLSHGYYVTKGRQTPRKVSLRVHRDQIAQRWEYVEHLASSLVEVVKEDDPDKVPANTRACGAYGGCPHAAYCTASNRNSLSLGEDLARLAMSSTETPKERYDMSLLDKLRGATTSTKTDVKSEMIRLQTEEINAKYPGALGAICALEALGVGMPALAGEALRVYNTAHGRPDSGPLTGSGSLGPISLSDANLIVTILAEAQEMLSTGALVAEAKVVDPFPADAPAALASPPAEAETKSDAPITTAEEAMKVAAGDAPKAKRRGRPTKEETAAKKAAEALALPRQDEIVVEHGTLVDGVDPNLGLPKDEPTSKAINFFVDCVPAAPYESFWPVVNRITSAIAQRCGGDDYRACPEKSEAGFGRWKGMLAAGLRALAASGQIPGGNYVFDNTMNETAGVVIEAMREIVVQSGGLSVRGIR